MTARPRPETLVPVAAATFADVVAGLPDEGLGAPTPCPDYDVAGLLGHLLHRGPQLVGAASKEGVPAGEQVPADPATWRAALVALVDRLAEAWSQPAAWEGTTRIEGPMEMPASTIGGIVLAEMVVHGWDLARATGYDTTIEPDLAEEALDISHGLLSPELRETGVFGPEVPISADDPLHDRLVAFVGRRP